MGMDEKELNERNAKNAKILFREGNRLLSQGRACFDTKGKFNPKTKWFILGLRGESKGVGIDEANRLLNELRDSIKPYYSQPGYDTDMVPALIFKKHDMYMKWLFYRKEDGTSYLRIVLHSQKENELYKKYKDDYVYHCPRW